MADSIFRKQVILKKIFKIPFMILNDFALFFITYMPGRMGKILRYIYWSKRFKKCGKHVIIDEGVIIQNPKWITIGDNVWIDKYVVLIAGAVDPSTSSKVFITKENKKYKHKFGELIIEDNVHIAPFCTIQAHGGLYIGRNTGIASGSRIYTLSHHYRNINNKNDRFEYKFTPMAPKEEQALISSPVYIGNNCAIGLNCVILPGSIVNDGTWIGVSSYLMGETDFSSIYGIEKVKFIKKKFD